MDPAVFWLDIQSVWKLHGLNHAINNGSSQAVDSCGRTSTRWPFVSLLTYPGLSKSQMKNNVQHCLQRLHAQIFTHISALHMRLYVCTRRCLRKTFLELLYLMNTTNTVESEKYEWFSYMILLWYRHAFNAKSTIFIILASLSLSR